MSVRKLCENCKFFTTKGKCGLGDYHICGVDLKLWELSDDAKADLLHDAVSHPSHYTSGGIECIDCIKAALGENFMGFLIGNVIKYTYRYKHKNGIQDLEKARWYLDRAIKELTDNAEE